METALFLGLTSGGACLATCGPLVAAFLAAEQITLKRSAALLTVFLSGRLLGYIGWAVVSWLLGQAIFQNAAGHDCFRRRRLGFGRVADLLWDLSTPRAYPGDVPRLNLESFGFAHDYPPGLLSQRDLGDPEWAAGMPAIFSRCRRCGPEPEALGVLSSFSWFFTWERAFGLSPFHSSEPSDVFARSPRWPVF